MKVTAVSWPPDLDPVTPLAKKLIATAQAEVWPDIRAEVGTVVFDTALQYAGLE